MSQLASEWDFARRYDEDIPPPLRFGTDGFIEYADYIKELAKPKYPTELRVVNVVATYASGDVKKRSIQAAAADDKAQYARGATLSTADKAWRFGDSLGLVGVVTSGLSNAVEKNQGEDNWHSVAVAKVKATKEVFVFDPEYDAVAHAGSVNRLDSIAGTRIVRELVRMWPQDPPTKTKEVWVQGPPQGWAGQGRLECMSRSAQWVEDTARGALPFPPNASAKGGVWKQYYLN